MLQEHKNKTDGIHVFFSKKVEFWLVLKTLQGVH